MVKSAECEYRGSAAGVSRAIKRQGVPRTTRSCSRPGENNIDRVCDFLEIGDSSTCPKILYDAGAISMEELIARMFGR